MKKYSKRQQKQLAAWAARCAERVLPVFEKTSTDKRPRKAIATLKKWITTGVFSMKEIRAASLGAHAAARAVGGKARFAARAAGQAVATAHVTQHALGAAYYALKVADNPAKELAWQRKTIPIKKLGKRIFIEERKKGIFIGIRKGKDF